MTNTCSTCRWWSTDRQKSNGEYNVGRFVISPEDIDTGALMALPFEVRYCNCPKITFHERPVEPNGATVVDVSMYEASLITGPEFGCVLWKGFWP